MRFRRSRLRPFETPSERSFWHEVSRRGAGRGVLAIAATYVAFLLFAQFGFLRQVQADLGDTGPVRAVMAAMGIAGLAASLGTAWLLGRVPALRLLRAGLGAVAGVAVISVACHGFVPLLLAAAAVGASIGLLTVALATALPEIVPRQSMGLAAGVGTGVAYFVSNVPVLFEAAPVVRALFPAALALLALVLAPHPPGPSLPSPPDPPGEGGTRLGLLRLVVIFLVLVWLDSAAFAIVQASPELKAQTWGSVSQKLVQGSVHLAAAVGAGILLDLGFGLAVPLAAWVLFAVAFPLLQHGGSAAAGPLYAVGISLYSTALVVMPAWRAQNATPPPRWRAGLLYGVAGWLGSALGVGMAQDLGRIPGWFLGVTGAVLALVTLSRLSRVYGPALLLGLLVSVGIGLEATVRSPEPDQAPDQASDQINRGRRVYVEEGCIHCHSQYVRPGTQDEALWGPSHPLDRGEQPPLVGTRRQGPDLLAVGNRRSAVWQELHLRDPRILHPGSRMPSYAHLFASDGQRGRDLVTYLMSLGARTAVERSALTAAETIAPPPLPPSVARGEALFVTWCAACHGAGGRGDGPLAGKLNDPFVDLRRPRLVSPVHLARTIRHGLPPLSMPGHEWLSDQQVADLVAYVETLPVRKEIP